jgi:DNA-binding MarR family transcriptional regulator
MTKTSKDVFDLSSFLPYVLNQAAEATSRSFQPFYAGKYGMTRTQWRVIANIGKFGSMTAKQICDISHLEKSKVSRAIAAMEADSLLMREESSDDRRAEVLTLTSKGKQRFRQLGEEAVRFDTNLRHQLGPEAATHLVRALQDLIAINGRQ